LEMCLEAVKQSGGALKYVPENLKTAEMCLEAVRWYHKMIEYVPENLKTAEIIFESENHQNHFDLETELIDDDEEFMKMLKSR